MKRDLTLENSPVGRWLKANRGLENFDEATRSLVSYACAEWFRRASGMLLKPEEALSRILALNLPGCLEAKWLDSPKDFCPEIADFCEKMKTMPLPEALVREFPGELDLRGVRCPFNASRSRLVLSGLPSGSELQILLDDGSPIENVPAALVASGYRVGSREKKDGYWTIKVVKS